MAMLPLSLIAGLLAGAWAYLSNVTGLVTWPAFIALALFFAAGADMKAAVKVTVSGAIGIASGIILLTLLPMLGGSLVVLGILVVIIAAGQVMLGNFQSVIFPSAELAATATYLGLVSDKVGPSAAVMTSALPWVIGVVGGFLIVNLAGLFAPKKAADKKAA